MNEKEIRSREVQDEYLRLCEEDAKHLIQYEKDFIEVDCPACLGQNHKVSFIKQGYKYSICQNCDSLFLSRRPTEPMLMEFNSTSKNAVFWAKEFYPKCAEKRRESVYRKRALFVKELESKYNKTFNKLIDIGTGFGIFIEELAKEFPNREIQGLEPGKSLAEVCKLKGLQVLEGFLKDTPQYRNHFDFCSCFEVLEHAFSPVDFLKEALEVCAPNGIFFTNTLCCDGFDIQVMWEKHRNVYPVNHINILSLKGMEMLFKRAGFINVAITTPGKLDMDIIRSQMKQEEMPRFLFSLYSRHDQRLIDRFQNFLAENKMSSHIWVVAQKP